MSPSGKPARLARRRAPSRIPSSSGLLPLPQAWELGGRDLRLWPERIWPKPNGTAVRHSLAVLPPVAFICLAVVGTAASQAAQRGQGHQCQAPELHFHSLHSKGWKIRAAAGGAGSLREEDRCPNRDARSRPVGSWAWAVANQRKRCYATRPREPFIQVFSTNRAILRESFEMSFSIDPVASAGRVGPHRQNEQPPCHENRRIAD